MKIGVNARLLAEPYTGIGRYTQNLFRKLAKKHPDDEFTLVVPKEIQTKFPRNVKIEVLPEKKWLISASLKKGWWEAHQLPRFFRKNKFDLLHYTYLCPFTDLETPLVATIHDVIPFKNPEYQQKTRSKIYFNLITKTVGAAPITFLAVSETTRKEAIEHLGIPEGKIVTTYEAASKTYLTPPEYPEKALRKHEIKRPYLLYIGGYDERKNVKYLCQIFSEIQKSQPDLTLVLAGGKLHSNKLYSSYDLPKNFEKGTINLLRTGFVEEEELNALYRGSIALINLSKQEGFNLPILEAAYTETPIVTSDIEVHRELYENHALLLPLDDPKSATETLAEFLENSSLQEEYRAKTAKLREKYTWEKAAEKTYEAYMRTIDH